MFVFVVVVVFKEAHSFTCDKDIVIPHLQLCDAAQQVLCDRIAALEQAVDALSTPSTEATPMPNEHTTHPPGTVLLMETQTPCPSGYQDKTDTYKDRYIAVGATAGTTHGTTSTLSSRRSPVHPMNDMRKPFEGGFNSPQLYIYASETDMPEPFTKDLAPLVLFRVCVKTS